MSDFNILIHPDHFGEHNEDDGLLMGDVLASFLDREENQWFAFELADMDGVFVICTASRFFIAVGTEHELHEKAEVMKK